jgi:hypothetical protein
VQRQAIVGRLRAIRDALPERLNPLSVLSGVYRLALLGLVIWMWLRGLRAVWHFTIDDAGISYAYAKHIAEGLGPVAVVGGPWVEGYSNPLWVFLLIPFQWLGLELPLVAKWLGVFCFAAAAVLGGASLTIGARGRGWGAVQALFAAALGCWLETAVWAVAGLENSLFWALLAGLVYLDAREAANPNARRLSGLVAFGVCITRPEGLLYIAPWLALQGLQALRPSTRQQALRALCLWLVPLAAYQALHYLVFRHWLPNTFHAKSSRWSWSDSEYYLLQSLRESGLSYALPLLALGLLRRSRLELLLGWTCLAGVVFIGYSGGDWMPHGRFLSLFAPAALALAAAGVDSASRRLAGWTRRRLPAEVFALVFGAGLLWFWWQHQTPRLARLERERWCHFCERVEATKAVQRLSRRAQLGPTTLLTQDFGGPSWLSNDRLMPIDFLGLCDRNVALLREDMLANHGNLRRDFRFYQYLFHEQPQAPSWLSLPSNFWPFFDSSPEYRLDYFRLDWRLMPRTRGYFGLHKAELVDYFPPLPRHVFRPLSSSLELVGAASFADADSPAAEGTALTVAPGVRVRTLVSVVAQGRLSGGEQLQLQIEGGGERVASKPVALTRGLEDVAAQLSGGDPLSVEFTLELPKSPAPVYQLRLGALQRSDPSPGGEPTWIDLEPLSTGAPLEPARRQLPRYPAALPPPLHSELRALRPAVTAGIEKRRRFGFSSAPDAALVSQLTELGRGYQRDGFAADAYLAEVWATQLDPRAWERLSDRIFQVRQTPLDEGHPLEIGLLQHYYAGGEIPALAALVGFYVSRQRLDEARFFLRYRPGSAAGSEPWASFDAALERLATAVPGAAAQAEAAAAEATLSSVARDPFGGAFDFETPGLPGWEGDRSAFLAGQTQVGPTLRGYHGHGVLSSEAPDDKARGVLLSPPFPLRGHLLSVLVGGGKRRVGVELLVDGQVLQRAAAHDSDFLFPALWDISALQGKTARLRVFDNSKDAHVLVDRVLLWD